MQFICKDEKTVIIPKFLAKYSKVICDSIEMSRDKNEVYSFEFTSFEIERCFELYHEILSILATGCGGMREEYKVTNEEFLDFVKKNKEDLYTLFKFIDFYDMKRKNIFFYAFKNCDLFSEECREFLSSML